MTNKLRYFIGNWKMFGDFGSFKIIHKINQFSHESKNQFKKKIILCVPNTLIYFFKKKLKANIAAVSDLKILFPKLILIINFFFIK